ncbi:Rhodanese-like domain-containing protein [Myxozyma melibiosi]|uniref:Rhodanese-like domain-containing protein n=1 Tax=Myxozyma melibiosi TaxID=54550 RepID=A0ABR1FFS6_9ASCO
MSFLQATRSSWRMTASAATELLLQSSSSAARTLTRRSPAAFASLSRGFVSVPPTTLSSAVGRGNAAGYGFDKLRTGSSVFKRFESSESGIQPPVQYEYKAIKELSENPHPDKILVDVREPIEVHREGFIPTAINIPYKSAPEALSLSDDEFEYRFGFEKPSKDKELVFYCLGGVRCDYAQQIAGEFGYQKRGNYAGSWEDWVANEKKERI